MSVNAQEYKFGRIYTGTEMQDEILVDFLDAQIVQDPFLLYTNWLLVEHVDEVVTFVPDLAGGGSAFKVLIADDEDGPDNRPSGESPWTGSATTDENGQAIVTFTVSMQPGNNYRAGASCLQDALSQAGQSDADALSSRFNEQTQTYTKNGSFYGYKVPLVWSKMLTVWRKLHVEVDSMDAEPTDLMSRLGDWEWTNLFPTATFPGQPSPGFTTVVPGPDCLLCSPNRYEGGAFRRTDTGSELLIVRNDGDGVIVWGDPGNVPGIECILRDDDLIEPLQLPQTSVLTGEIVYAYRDAYVEIVEATTALNPQAIVPWERNVSSLELAWDHDFVTGVCSQWNLDSADSFWARHFVTCYQAGTDEDADSDGNENCWISQNCLAVDAPYSTLGLSSLTETMDSGLSLGLTVRNTILHGTATSVVFKETIRDEIIDSTSAQFWQFVAHELGHSTLDQNGQKAPLGAEHAEGGLMSEGALLQNLPLWQSFTAETLIRFRGAKRW